MLQNLALFPSSAWKMKKKQHITTKKTAKQTDSSISKRYYSSQLPILPARGRAAKWQGTQEGAVKVRAF